MSANKFNLELQTEVLEAKSGVKPLQNVSSPRDSFYDFYQKANRLTQEAKPFSAEEIAEVAQFLKQNASTSDSSPEFVQFKKRWLAALEKVYGQSSAEFNAAKKELIAETKAQADELQKTIPASVPASVPQSVPEAFQPSGQLFELRMGPEFLKKEQYVNICSGRSLRLYDRSANTHFLVPHGDVVATTGMIGKMKIDGKLLNVAEVRQGNEIYYVVSDYLSKTCPVVEVKPVATPAAKPTTPATKPNTPATPEVPAGGGAVVDNKATQAQATTPTSPANGDKPQQDAPVKATQETPKKLEVPPENASIQTKNDYLTVLVLRAIRDEIREGKRVFSIWWIDKEDKNTATIQIDQILDSEKSWDKKVTEVADLLSKKGLSTSGTIKQLRNLAKSTVDNTILAVKIIRDNNGTEELNDLFYSENKESIEQGISKLSESENKEVDKEVNKVLGKIGKELTKIGEAEFAKNEDALKEKGIKSSTEYIELLRKQYQETLKTRFQITRVIKKTDESLFIKNNKDLWENYRSAVDPKDEWFTISDESSTGLANFVCYDLTSMIISGGIAGLSVKALSIGARMAIGAERVAQISLGASRVNQGLRVASSVSKAVTEGAIFTTAHNAIRSQELIWNNPNWAQEIALNSITFGAFRYAKTVKLPIANPVVEWLLKQGLVLPAIITGVQTGLFSYDRIINKDPSLWNELWSTFLLNAAMGGLMVKFHGVNESIRIINGEIRLPLEGGKIQAMEFEILNSQTNTLKIKVPKRGGGTTDVEVTVRKDVMEKINRARPTTPTSPIETYTLSDGTQVSIPNIPEIHASAENITRIIGTMRNFRSMTELERNQLMWDVGEALARNDLNAVRNILRRGNIGQTSAPLNNALEEYANIYRNHVTSAPVVPPTNPSTATSGPTQTYDVNGTRVAIPNAPEVIASAENITRIIGTMRNFRSMTELERNQLMWDVGEALARNDLNAVRNILRRGNIGQTSAPLNNALAEYANIYRAHTISTPAVAPNIPLSEENLKEIISTLKDGFKKDSSKTYILGDLTINKVNWKFVIKDSVTGVELFRVKSLAEIKDIIRNKNITKDVFKIKEAPKAGKTFSINGEKYSIESDGAILKGINKLSDAECQALFDTHPNEVLEAMFASRLWGNMLEEIKNSFKKLGTSSKKGGKNALKAGWDLTSMTWNPDSFFLKLASLPVNLARFPLINTRNIWNVWKTDGAAIGKLGKSISILTFGFEKPFNGFVQSVATVFIVSLLAKTAYEEALQDNPETPAELVWKGVYNYFLSMNVTFPYDLWKVFLGSNNETDDAETDKPKVETV